MASETAENGNDFQSPCLILYWMMRMLELSVSELGRELRQHYKHQHLSLQKLKQNLFLIDPPTYLETLLKRHSGTIEAFYMRNGRPENNEEKIALLVQRLNASRNIGLENLELQLLWKCDCLSNDELSHFD